MISTRISCLSFVKWINVSPHQHPRPAAGAHGGKGSFCRVMNFHPCHPAPSLISEPAKTPELRSHLGLVESNKPEMNALSNHNLIKIVHGQQLVLTVI